MKKSILNSETMLIAALFVAPSLALPVSMSSFFIPKTVFIGWIAGVIALRMVYMSDRDFSASLKSADKGAVSAVAGILFINAFMSANINLTLQTASCIAGGCVLILFFSNLRPERLIIAASYGTFFPIAAGVAQRLYGHEYFLGDDLSSSIGNFNLFSMWLSVAFPFCAGSALIEKNLMRRVFHAAAGAGSLFLVYESRVAGGIAAFATGMVLLFAFKTMIRQSSFVKLILCSLPVVLIVADLSALYCFSIASPDLALLDYGSRTRIIHSASILKMALSRPLYGWGFGTFMAVYPRFQLDHFGFEMLRAHNEFLQLFSETGLAGVLIAFALIASISRRLLFSPVEESKYFRVAAASIGATVVAALSSFPFHEPATALYSICAVAIAFAKSHELQEHETDLLGQAVKKGRLAKRKFPVGASMIIIVWFSWISAPLASEILIKRGVVFEEQNDFVRASSCFETAVALNPSNGYAQFLLGAAMLQKKDIEQARIHLLQAKRTRDFGSLHYLLAQVYLSMGDKKAAQYELAMARDRGFGGPPPATR